MKALTNSEILIMKCLWDCGGEMPMLELMKRLNDVYQKDWKRTTIRTFLLHLEEKGYLKTYQIGRNSYVKQSVLMTDFRYELTKDWIAFWYEGSVSEMLKSLDERKSLTENEKEKILSMIQCSVQADKQDETKTCDKTEQPDTSR